MFERIRRILGSPEAMVAGSANQQRIISDGLAALLQASANQQECINASLPALVASSIETQRLLREVLMNFKEPAISFFDQLKTQGFSVVKGFLNPGQASELTALVSEIYTAMDAAGEKLAFNADFAKNYQQWSGIWMEPLSEFLDGELSDRYATFTESLQGHVRCMFGSHWNFYPHRSFFRRHIGVGKAVPWHIDADAAHLNQAECINIWLPLDSVGQTKPTLEIVPNSHAAMRQTPLIQDADRWRDDAFVARIGATLAPVLEPGDAMAFDQYTLHRTQPIGSPSTIRTACEFRFARAA